MRKHKQSTEEVKINLTAMLDMAFQLLSFFIFTFRPSPVEGQLQMHLPAPSALTNISTKAQESTGGGGSGGLDDPKSMEIAIKASGDGQVASLMLGANGMSLKGAATPAVLNKLDLWLRDSLGVPGTPYDQVILKVAPQLKYEELMKVMDVCLQQKLADGKRLEKIGFVQLTE